MAILYRKIYEMHHGSIPTDSNGRTFEIHHKDGDRSNNCLTNLVALSIEDHYNIHYEQGDYDACALIAARMTSELIIDEQTRQIFSERMQGKNNPSHQASGPGHWSKGTVVVKDSKGVSFRVSTDDPRYISGELVHVNKGKVLVRDGDGGYHSVRADDPRYLSGELIHATCGTLAVKDCDGTTYRVSLDDPRYISGELVPHRRGEKIHYTKEEVDAKYSTRRGRPAWNRGKKGLAQTDERKQRSSEALKGKKKEVVTCPHCKKAGGKPAMTRYHFNNCKEK